MAPAKRKTQKKELSFEHYARAIQTDIAQLGKSMETGFKSMREEIGSIRGEMAAGFNSVRDEMATHKNLLEVRDDTAAQRHHGFESGSFGNNPARTR